MDNNLPPSSEIPEAPDKEEMDQIRRRRLEKLGGPPATKSEEQTSSESAPPPDTPATSATPVKAASPAPKINISKAPTSFTPTSNPFAKAAANTAAANIKSTSTTTPRSTLRNPAAQAQDESIEMWEDRTLGGIFRLTLDPNQKSDASNHRLIHLAGVRQDLHDEGEPILLTTNKLDQALMEACSAIPNTKAPLDYLLPCWKRTMKAIRGLRGYASRKDEVLKEAKRLCMSHCIFAVTMPELYNREPNPMTDSLVPYLLHEPGDDNGLCPDFLTELVSRMSDDETVGEMLGKAVRGLSYQLSQITMNDNYKQYVIAMKQLCQFPKIVTAIAQDSLFHMAQSAVGIEKHTILGPFFRISPLQKEVTKTYFGSPKTLQDRQVKTSQESLQLTLRTHQQDLLDIINCFVRASPESKNKTLDWFAHIVNANHMRRALQPDASTLSSDGFLMNITVVLDGLCEPFMDTMFSKVGKIDIEYLRRSPRVDIKEETKINADENASNEYYAIEAPGSSNFISEVFFLTLAAHHYGSGGTEAKLKSLAKDIKYLNGKMAELEKERPKFANSPTNMARFEEQLRKFAEVLDNAMSMKMAIEGVLCDKDMQGKSLMFMRVVTVWLMRVATNTDYKPEIIVKLPLTVDAPAAFKCLPEYVLEDILSNFNFVFRNVPQVMLSAFGDETVSMCITLLTNSEYIKNPYLKAKVVSLLFHGTYPVYHKSKGVFGDTLTSSKFANDHLLHALMKFYIEVENTGVHTQFYDKFNIRYEIFQVIKCVWSNDIYRQRLTQESKVNTQFFLRFVNLLLNDVTYVLDEALTKFPKIHDIQQELKDPTRNLTQEQRATKQEELATAENQASSYMQLTNETVSMMKLFTGSLSSSFTMSEIVDRVAAMLNYTLETIVGPKSSQLLVENPEKYGFRPKTLLGEFIDIYLNLGVSDAFIAAVARDGRSYKPSTFSNASRVITVRNIRSPEEIQSWGKLVDRFAKAKELDDQDEEDLGEPPEEFMDPLMASLMLDPVTLPVSRQVVDRSTIQAHLLSDPKDPFNRVPLTIEEVIDNVELREKVFAWRDEQMALARARRAAKPEEMDTTEG